MAPPTQEQTDSWNHQYDVIPYNDKFRTPTRLRLMDLDPLPEPDEKSRRFVEGWKSRWEGVVEEGWGNFTGNMHGAVTAWIVDTFVAIPSSRLMRGRCTSASLVAIHTDSFWGPPVMAGVSLAINTEYYHPAPLGTEILVICEIVRVSTALANTTCEIRDRKTGKLFSSGTHIKAWRPVNTAKL